MPERKTQNRKLMFEIRKYVWIFEKQNCFPNKDILQFLVERFHIEWKCLEEGF